jgi:hypothetical protein
LVYTKVLRWFSSLQRQEWLEILLTCAIIIITHVVEVEYAFFRLYRETGVGKVEW